MRIIRRFFYHWFTDKIIAKAFVFYCWLIGIRKGRMFITQSPGYTNRMDGGHVGWSEIKYFSWVWVTYTRFSFSICFYTYLNKAKEMGLNDVFIQNEYFNTGHCTIKEILDFFKAQSLLQKQYTRLYKPA